MSLNTGTTKLASITQNNHVYEYTAESPTPEILLNVRSPYRRQKRDLSIIRLSFRRPHIRIEIPTIISTILSFFRLYRLLPTFLSFYHIIDSFLFSCDRIDYFLLSYLFATILTISYLSIFLLYYRLFLTFLRSYRLFPIFFTFLRLYRLYPTFLFFYGHIDYFLPSCNYTHSAN
jgi:hypothetical protein